MEKKRLIESRLRVLRDAAAVLQVLRADMPAHVLRLEAADRALRKIADDYSRLCDRALGLEELETSKRKPPMRVSAPGRRKPLVVKKRRCLCGPFDTCAICRDEPPMDNSNVSEENEG